jgi:hypothetical protein
MLIVQRRTVAAATLPVVTSGLLAFWDMGSSSSYGGSGSTWTDISGNSNNLTLFNSPTYSTSNGGILSFNGTNQYARIASGIIPSNADFSIDFWFRYTGATSADQVFAATWDASYNGFGIGSYQTTMKSWAADGGTGGLNWATLSSLQNNWRQATLTYTRSTATQTVYLNASLLGSSSLFGSITHSAFRIAQNSPAEGYGNFSTSNCALYNKVLSGTEITANFNALRSRFGL